MKLPVELRLQIHELALQDSLQDVIGRLKAIKSRHIERSHGRGLTLPFVGPLALLDTSFTLREEAPGVMVTILRTEIEGLLATSAFVCGRVCYLSPRSMAQGD